MNSCLYECQVMHHRLEPKRYRFVHDTFMFYLDLDELDALSGRLRFFSRNRFNAYNFRDDDHIVLHGKTAKENILEYLKSRGVDWPGGRIMLLTNVRTFGHIFNPVSFYFCFDKQGEAQCVVPEIGNTFLELKPYFLGKEDFKEGRFHSRQVKHFYISPFVDLETSLDFQLKPPAAALDIRIDDYKEGRKFLLSSLMGERKELTDLNLLFFTLKIPLVTLKVLGLIHWHAFLLWLKQIPYYRKEDNTHLQKGVIRERSQ